jgi:hypothetical protein
MATAPHVLPAAHYELLTQFTRRVNNRIEPNKQSPQQRRLPHQVLPWCLVMVLLAGRTSDVQGKATDCLVGISSIDVASMPPAILPWQPNEFGS